MDEKRLNEIKGEFIDQTYLTSQVTQAYERGEVEFSQVSQNLNKLHEIAGKMNIFMGEVIRDIYQRGRVANEKRRKQNITELGFTP